MICVARQPGLIAICYLRYVIELGFICRQIVFRIHRQRASKAATAWNRGGCIGNNFLVPTVGEGEWTGALLDGWAQPFMQRYKDESV